MPYDPDIDYVPENAESGGTIQVTDIVEETTSVGVKLRISGKVTSIEPGIKQFTPYIKWILENTNSQIVASGMEYTSHQKNYKPYQSGDTFQLEIQLFWGITGTANSGNARTFEKGQYYSIRFVEDYS